MNKRVRNRLLLLGCAALVLVFDQWTKVWVVANLPLYTPVDLLDWMTPILSFTYVKNTGVAFGLFPQLGQVFTVLQIVVILGIIYYQRTLPDEVLWLHLSLGLVVGGALGNLVDRILRGYVVDFLDVNFWPLQQWPVFNLADSAIVVGVTIMLIDSFFEEQVEQRQVERKEVTADA